MSKQVFISPIDEAFLTERDVLGSIRWEVNKCYKYVELYNDLATIAGVIGDQLLYNKNDGHLVSRVLLDASSADAVPVAAGVCNCVVAGIQDTSYYMWMQIKGPVILSQLVSGGPNDGQPIMATLADKTFGRADEVTTGNSMPTTCGIIQNTTSRFCVLDCPF